MQNKKTSEFFIVSLIFISLLLVSCEGMPKNATSVKNFNIEKYLGKWYEIARLDFKYERNLNNTTALYELNDDGSVKVTNRGYNYVENKWQEANGKAVFRGDAKREGSAELKVSFFGPFYGSYNVIALDENYQYALVVGNSTKYLWILSRTTTIPLEIKEAYLEQAKLLGYNNENLVWVEHN